MSTAWINERIEKAMKDLDDANSQLYFIQNKLAQPMEPKLRCWIEDNQRMAIRHKKNAELALRKLTEQKTR